MPKVIDQKHLQALHAKKSIRKLKEAAKPQPEITYVGLARVSTIKQQTKGQSLETQKKIITDYCEQHKYPLSEIKVLAESASKHYRRQFENFLKHIKKQKGKIAIIVSRSDRLTRQDCNALDTLRQEDKIEIHLVGDYEVLTARSTPDEITSWEIHVSFAKRETKVLSNRVKENRNNYMENGQYQHKAPVGYLNTRDAVGRAIIIKDDKKFDKVKEVIELYAKGNQTLSTLCDYANKIGLTNRDNRPWRKNTMNDMLKNPFYCGYFYENGDIFTHNYGTMISEELFAKVQNILEGRSKKKDRANQKNANIFTLSNIVKCKCGCQMTCYEKTKPNGKSYRYVRCSHESTTTPCEVKQRTEDMFLDQIKDEVLSKLFIDPEILNIYKPAIRQAIQLEQVTSQQKLTQLQIQKNELEAELKGYIRSVSQGLISKTDYEMMKEDVNSKIANIEDQIATANISQEQVDRLLRKTMKLLSSGLKLFESSQVAEKNRFLKILLANCIYDGEKLQISVKKPFDLFVSKGLCSTWQPHSDLNRDSRLERAVS